MRTRYNWVKIDMPNTVGELRAMPGCAGILPAVPDDAEIMGGDFAASPPTIEYRVEWTAEEYAAEEARLRQIEIDEASDRKAGF